MPKKTVKKPVKKKSKVTTKTYKGKLEFKRMSTFGDLGFNIECDGMLTGKKVSFYGFMPDNFREKDLADYEITGSVTYKINVKKK